MFTPEMFVTVLVAVLASSGFWAWLIASRRLSTTEYRALVEDLQKERAHTNDEIKRLDQIIDRQDAEIHVLRLTITEQEIHIERLEGELKRLGGNVPARPAAQRTRPINNGNGDGGAG